MSPARGAPTVRRPSLVEETMRRYRRAKIVATVGPASASPEMLKALDRKGVNLPRTLLNLSPLTDKDRADLAFGLELGVDWVALSFVQKPSDVIEARGLVGDRAGIMSKIEKPQALERIEDIIRLSDAVMIARGDLGVEIPHEDVRTKELIRACRRAVKPVVVATQMLELDGGCAGSDARRGVRRGNGHL